MNLEVVPAAELSLGEQANVFNRAFAGYLAGWHEMDADGLARFICAQGADLCYSRFARADGRLSAFGYINRTGNFPRLAGMGTVPEARRTGAAAYLLGKLLEEAKMRGDEAMVLEVFEQNLPALSLYRRFGFTELTRLLGWRGAAAAGAELQSEIPGLEEISIMAACHMASAFEYPNTPWQISRHLLSKLSCAHAYRSDNFCMVIGDTKTSPIRVHAIFGPEKDWPELRSLCAAVLRKFSDLEFFAPPIFPEQFGSEIFAPLGFAREPLNQLLLRCDL